MSQFGMVLGNLESMELPDSAGLRPPRVCAPLFPCLVSLLRVPCVPSVPIDTSAALSASSAAHHLTAAGEHPLAACWTEHIPNSKVRDEKRCRVAPSASSLHAAAAKQGAGGSAAGPPETAPAAAAAMLHGRVGGRNGMAGAPVSIAAAAAPQPDSQPPASSAPGAWLLCWPPTARIARAHGR